MSSEVRRIQHLANEYTKDWGIGPIEPTEFAAWAVKHKRWAPTVEATIRLCAEQFSRAMREEYTTDRKGRRVRTKHVVRITKGTKTLWLWDDWEHATRSHMEQAFQLRRNQIVGDCYQLKSDVDSYNEAHADQPAIQLVLDFRTDVEELELARDLAA